MRISDWSSDVCSSDLHDRACDFLIAVGFLARRKVPFSAEEDFRLDEMKVRYLRCDGTSVWKDVEDWGEEIRLRCLEREITFVTLHGPIQAFRSEEHTSELQSLMRISYDVFCLKKKKKII